VVSALCVIPWTWRYEDVELKSGEMGIVGTLAEYRHRGLIRALVKRHHELLHEGQYDSQPHPGHRLFLRQFGYEYALPLEGGWKVELNEIPNELPEMERFQFRLATEDDIPTLMRLYDAAAQDLSISSQRDEAIWRYLLGRPWPPKPAQKPGWCWTQKASRWWATGGSRCTGLVKGRTSAKGRACLMGRRWRCWVNLRGWRPNGANPFIRLNIPRSHDLVKTARGWGAAIWALCLADAYPGCGPITAQAHPVLERRIAASAFAG